MNEHSPLPWRVIKAYDDEPARIIDADDDEVAVELIDADASLIVEAVNGFTDALALADECSRAAAAERAARARAVEEAQREANQRADRLADLVRRMLPCVEKAFENAKRTGAAVKGLCALRGVDSGAVDEILKEWSALLREAREAVGEVAP